MNKQFIIRQSTLAGIAIVIGLLVTFAGMVSRVNATEAQVEHNSMAIIRCESREIQWAQDIGAIRVQMQSIDTKLGSIEQNVQENRADIKELIKNE